MTLGEKKQYTAEEKARFRKELAEAEARGIDTFCPDTERHRQKWQHRKDKLLAQIAEAKDYKERERLQLKLVELEQAWKRSDENLAYLRDLHGLNN